MRRSPRPLAAALVLLGLVAAVPASAHIQPGEHTIRWVDQQPDQDSPDDGEKLYDVDYIVAEADFEDEVARWRIEMQPEAGGEPSFCDSGTIPPNARKRVHLLECNWDTAHIGDMSDLDRGQHLASDRIAPNGPYVITVTAWNSGRGEPCGGLLSPSCLTAEAHVLQPTRTVTVVNPVSPVRNVGRSYNSGNGRVTVSWAASPEPDVTKYVIQEKKGDAAWKSVGERPHGTTSFERYLPEMGTYQYRVAAVRPAVEQSDWTGTAPLEVAAPPAPPQEETPRNAPEDPGPDPGPDPGGTGAEPPTTTSTQGGAPAPTAPPRSSGGGSNLFPRPPVSSAPPTTRRTPPTTADTGYSEELPYNTTTTEAPDEDEVAGAEGESRAIRREITVPGPPEDPRSLLVPLAGGLAIFVFAMQMTYFVRRRPALARAEDDFADDWTGF